MRAWRLLLALRMCRLLELQNRCPGYMNLDLCFVSRLKWDGQAGSRREV